MLPMGELGLQAVKAIAFYAALVGIVRLAGKRLSGQTTTFDLIVLITLGVVLQTIAVGPGPGNALTFVVTLFFAHKLVAVACKRSVFLKHLVRGKPRVLVRRGEILHDALAQEGLTKDELLAGLRKQGHERIEAIETAVIEETGHISAVARSP